MGRHELDLSKLPAPKPETAVSAKPPVPVPGMSPVPANQHRAFGLGCL